VGKREEKETEITNPSPKLCLAVIERGTEKGYRQWYPLGWGKSSKVVLRVGGRSTHWGKEREKKTGYS